MTNLRIQQDAEEKLLIATIGQQCERQLQHQAPLDAFPVPGVRGVMLKRREKNTFLPLGTPLLDTPSLTAVQGGMLLFHESRGSLPL